VSKLACALIPEVKCMYELIGSDTMKWKKPCLRVLIYGIFVFLSILLVLALRSASLVWIHHDYMSNPWSIFEGRLNISIVISAIQTTIMLLCALIYHLIRRTRGLQHIAGATLLLCILDLFIQPIAIWTMNYRIMCPVLTIGAVLVFPLFAWLVLFFLPVNQKSANRDIQQIPPVEHHCH